MPNFDSGVKGYITGVCIAKVHFPIDFNGHADISCKQCTYYTHSYRTCKLNGEICEYPDSYVGSRCPLEQSKNGILISDELYSKIKAAAIKDEIEVEKYLEKLIERSVDLSESQC